MEKKGKKVRSFAKRLTGGIAITQLVVMAIASYLIYNLTREFIQDEETDLYKSYLKAAHQDIRRVLSNVNVATMNSVPVIEENLNRPDKMYSIVEQMVALNPHIRSCGISFVANYYPGKGRWFCPFAVKGDSTGAKKRIIGSTRNDYLNAEWFTKALEADSSYWSKPFFDATDSVPLVARLVPIHDKQGRTVAILGADLSLNWFGGSSVSTVSINGQNAKVYFGNNPNFDGEDGDTDIWYERKWRAFTFNFIIDKDGTFIAHPDSSRIINGNYFDYAKKTADTTDDQVGREMVAGKSGTYWDEDGRPEHFEFFDGGGFDNYVFYEPIEGTDWTIANAVPRFMIDGAGIVLSSIMVVLIAIGLLVTRIVGRIFIKHATKPLNKLANSANEVAKGNFSAPLPRIKHNDEIRLLRDSFEGMQHSLADYVEELKETTASKAAIENELKVAHDIQMSMLPKTFPPYPERDDIDIYGTLTPAKDVGGDLFDFYIRDEKLYFCIGDVSGKGVPASLVMAMTRSLFRNISANVAEPHRIVEALNKSLTDGNETNMFVTLFLGVLDLHTGRLAYCNAGHNAPLLIGQDVKTMSCESNLPLGVTTDWTFVPQQMMLESGSMLFLFTDGLNEAENADCDQFGDERIASVAASIVAEGNSRPDTIVGRMSDAVHSFVGNAEQSDDLTMLSIKYQNPASAD